MVKSFGYYCTRYVIYAVIVTVVTFMIVYALYAFATGFAAKLLEGGGGSGVGIVTIILPAMLVAQVFYKHEQRRMGRAEGWSMAVVFTLLAFMISGVSFLAVLQFAPVSDEEAAALSALWNDNSSVLVIIAGIFALFIVLINRLMLWSGVRGEIKKAERAASRS